MVSLPVAPTRWRSPHGRLRSSRSCYVTAVTVAVYVVCVNAGKCTAPSRGGDCNWGRRDRLNHPINCVSWDEAVSFCAFLGKRLPTDEEREWAAREAERGTAYPWGTEEPRISFAGTAGT